MSRWKKVGVVCVDSGRLLITDYLEHPTITRGEIAKRLSANKFPRVQQIPFESGLDGAGISVQTGFGDGTYDVEVDIGDVKGYPEGGRRVRAVRILFIDKEVDE